MKSVSNNKGQILIEYILLLLISVSLATILVKQLVGRGDTEQGIIISSWSKIIKSLGNDLPDCPNQKDFSKPNCPP